MTGRAFNLILDKNNSRVLYQAFPCCDLEPEHGLRPDVCVSCMRWHCTSTSGLYVSNEVRLSCCTTICDKHMY